MHAANLYFRSSLICMHSPCKELPTTQEQEPGKLSTCKADTECLTILLATEWLTVLSLLPLPTSASCSQIRQAEMITLSASSPVAVLTEQLKIRQAFSSSTEHMVAAVFIYFGSSQMQEVWKRKWKSCGKPPHSQKIVVAPSSLAQEPTKSSGKGWWFRSWLKTAQQWKKEHFPKVEEGWKLTWNGQMELWI